MTTLAEIEKVHDEHGNANTLGSYLRGLRALGVMQYSSYVSDGHSIYQCADGQILQSEAVHEQFTVANTVDKKRFQAVMERTEKGEIGYLEMSKALAESGVERWKFDTGELTISYMDKAGTVIAKEQVEDQ